MMEGLPHLILFLTAFLMVLASVDGKPVPKAPLPIPPLPIPPLPKPSIGPLKSMFMFGDSLFDAGNNPYNKNCSIQANFTPYGMSYFRNPTGRFTDGRNVADFFAQYLGAKLQKPFQEVYHKLSNGSLKSVPVNGINFASAGSGILPNTNTKRGVTPIQTQLRQLQFLVDRWHLDKKIIKRTLFFLESGSNDIATYFVPTKKQKPRQEEFVQTMIKEVTNFLDKIYKVGARKIAIFSIGPLGCIPAKVFLLDAPLNQCSRKVNSLAKYYNSYLEKLVKEIPTKYPGAVGVYGAVYDIIEQIQSNSRLYGFTEVNKACCGGGLLNGMLQCGKEGYKVCENPKEYFYWDYFHPTEHTYKLVANALWAGGTKQVRPMNIKTFADMTVK